MEKWEIRSTPSADDPERHVLLLQGVPADVAALLKKFGALMGRPSPAKAEGFNFSLVLHRLKPAARAKLDAWLTQAAPPPAPPAPAAAPPKLEPPAPAPTPAPPPASPPEPSASIPPAVPVPVELPAIPSLKMPEEKPVLVSLSPEPAAAPVPPVPKAPAPVVVAPPAAAAAAAAPAPVSLPSPSGALAEFPFTVELRPDWTLDTLLVGAYNRFAHAASMSVVTSPGSMYNPLFLYGVPGTGKSHMLNAIGASLSKGLGGAVLFSTSGARLSRAVNAALARKALPEIEARAEGSKALLIDDIHLMDLSDQNKAALAKIFKSFFDRKLQVVITSLYPPRSLGALEEALQFSFSKGWSVDLKIPSPAIQKDLISAAAERSHTGLDGEGISLIHEKLSVWGYSDLTLWLKRVVEFRKVREASGQVATIPEILRLIYEPVLTGGTEPPKPGAAKYTPPAAPPEAEPIAVLVPKGQEGLGAFAARLFYEVGQKNGFTQVFRHTLWDVYDATAPFGVPFQIGEMCRRAGVTRALIVGPAPDSPLGPRSAEFAHATRRILESAGVETAFIPYSGLQLDAHYMNAHLDLARARS